MRAESDAHDCGACDKPNSADVGMVACDGCSVWYHYTCAKVSPGVQQRSWRCCKCSPEMHPEVTGAKKKGGKKQPASLTVLGAASSENPKSNNASQKKTTEKSKNSEKSRTLVVPNLAASDNTTPKKHPEVLAVEKSTHGEMRSSKSSTSTARAKAQLALQRLEDERRLEEQKLKEERERLEEERIRLEKERQLKEQEHAIKAKELAMQEKYLREKFELEEQIADDDSSRKSSVLSRKDRTSAWLTSQHELSKQEDKSVSQYSEWPNLANHLAGPNHHQRPLELEVDRRQQEVLGNPEIVPNLRAHRDAMAIGHNQSDGNRFRRPYDAGRSNANQSPSLHELESAAIGLQPVSHGAGPNSEQIAARQIWPKKLPVFSGDPEEWPIFVHSFETANVACGFSDVENISLRECLRGPARDAVVTKLMFPQSVNAIMETLRRLYGRPELLVKNLLDKVRRAEAPKPERLESLINFGLTVQQLCDHLEAANLKGHLSNPTLLGELVEKLPASIKLEWARFKRAYAEPTLKHFGAFMEELVYDASEVTSPIQQKTPVTKTEKDKPKEKGHVFSHEDAAEVQNHREERQPCPICGKTDHRVRNRERFQQLDLQARLKAVDRYKLCEICLFDHGQWRCRSRIRCNVGNCRDRHHPLLHSSGRGPVQEQRQRQFRASECNAHERSQRSVLFRIIPVTLFNGNRKCETFAFLDEGSSLTLIESSLARQLGATGVPEPLELRWTSSVKRNEDSSKRVDFEISARGQLQRYVLKNAHTVGELNLPSQSLAIDDLSERFPHLRNLPVLSYTEAVPRILLGLENLSLFAPLDSCIGQPGEPIAVKSLLGWSVYGPEANAQPRKGFVNLNECNCGADKELNDLVRQQFIMEDKMIAAIPFLESDDEKRARELLENTTKFVDGRYETALLWKADDIDLPDSLPMAMKRLKSFEAQLAKDSDLRENVNQQIVDYIQKGYVHKATEEELREINRRQVWCLPLGLVTHPKKQKKRLMWDGKAQVNGISLNSQLLKGPDLLVSLPSVICKFREKRIGFGGDIREMFLQLRMRTADKYFQCFLFRFDPRQLPEVYIADVAMFGATCSPCVAQHVLRVNADKWADEFPLAATAIKNKTYMDDYYDSADTPEQAATLAVQVKTIHARGGFEMRNWVSNCEEVLKKLGESATVEPRPLQSTTEARWERVLGMLWHPKSDTLTFSTELGEQLLPYTLGELRPTERIALKIIMSLFDPLGLLAPYLIHGRVLIQDLWRSGVQWDEKMGGEEFEKWTRWVELLPAISKLSIPRYYFIEANRLPHSMLQCHVFSDASEICYGAAVYFRTVDGSGRVQCSLVMAKSKVAPLKHLSIPRLELEAAVLGAKLLHTVQTNHSLQPHEVYLWTDSLTVLSWIRSDHRRYKQFVAHRIGEILSLTETECWRWVPSKDNVADCLTKWVRDTEPDCNSRWFRGPAFLYNSEEMWPRQRVKTNTAEELRSSYLLAHIFLPGRMLDVRRFSKWSVLLRTVAYVYRFIGNCRLRISRSPIETIRATKKQEKLLKCSLNASIVPLKQEEFLRAEQFLWRMVQGEHYPDEVRTLLKNRNQPIEKWIAVERNSPLYRFSPFADELGIIRMEGRTVDAAYADFDTRCPIILPKDSDITRLLLDEYHRRYGHANKETVVNEVCQRFQISHLRTAVDSTSRNCQFCKVNKCKPRPPRMAPLPEQRLTPNVRPFSYVGIDYMGPLEVSIGRRKEKRYVAVFTCLVIRAVHLEVSYDLSSESCIMAIRRFTRRRGSPVQIFTDNGTNFVGASRELQMQIDLECAGTFTDARTKWSFNPPSAPHMGGVWERMVRSVKEAMTMLDDGRKLTDEILWTTLVEVEGLINSRPLTYMPQDLDNPQALTPNHFIFGCSSGAHEPLEPPVDLGQTLRSSFLRSQQLAEVAWKRWSKEYFPAINRRSKWLDEMRSLKVGDMVYVAEGKRRSWTRGIVDAVICGNDGRVRQAIVRTASGMLKRPVVKLAVMELGGSTEDPPLDPRGGGCSGSTGSDVVQNPIERKTHNGDC